MMVTTETRTLARHPWSPAPGRIRRWLARRRAPRSPTPRRGFPPRAAWVLALVLAPLWAALDGLSPRVAAAQEGAESEPAATVTDLRRGADRILGVWETEPEDDGQWARVRIQRCSDAYCGEIVWLSEPLVTEAESPEEAGQVKLDVNNPDEELRNRPILGLELMWGFRYEDRMWKDGRIYDPKSGKTYRCELRLAEGGDLLKVRGFVKVAFIKVGRTTEWTRYEQAGGDSPGASKPTTPR